MENRDQLLIQSHLSHATNSLTQDVKCGLDTPPSHVCRSMSLSTLLSRSSTTFQTAPSTPAIFLDFLLPTLHRPRQRAARPRKIASHHRTTSIEYNSTRLEACFFKALERAGSCHAHRRPPTHARHLSAQACARNVNIRRNFSTTCCRPRKALRWHGDYVNPPGYIDAPDLDESVPVPKRDKDGEGHAVDEGLHRQSSSGPGVEKPTKTTQALLRDVRHPETPPGQVLPEEDGLSNDTTRPTQPIPVAGLEQRDSSHPTDALRLLETVRDLETKLAQAKQKLNVSLRPKDTKHRSSPSADGALPLTLSREDYKGLVDLYYYTHKDRSTPEAPDASPTPQFLDDYSFKLSEDFAGPEAYVGYYEHESDYESPLKGLEQVLKSKHLREITVMQKFVELLLDDASSGRALYKVYRELPSPGVAFLPKGIIRVFLQRMSTPFTKTQNSMLRYLSLIDDMQKAKLPITRSEWSSAIYLAGRSFGRVNQGDMTRAFKVWRQMEHEAGVKASNVTFNILFDIAVRAGKYVIADNILREMHSRGLRLNRLGRVSLMYYHGLRADGDAVRKAFHDFVDAGEIVDTLVCTCVIASLMNAGEPAAAEQLYLRMKNLQTQLTLGKRANGNETIYRKYPGEPSIHINREMASNSLGRVLLKSGRLRHVLPEQHKSLQDSMPLRPDHITFKSMIAFYANVTGDLDRITVLVNEMVDTFDIPLRSIHYQLLFKGFALHGKKDDPDARWNIKRLNLTWAACRRAVKEAQTPNADASREKQTALLPSARAAELLPDDSLPAVRPPQRKRLSPWHEVALDLAAFPWSRRRHIERVHAELFDEVEVKTTKVRKQFFGPSRAESGDQETYYPLGDSTLDREEGEYTLPGPTEAIHANTFSTEGESPPVNDAALDEDEVGTRAPEMGLTKGLICWLLRAYTRCTGSREQVEQAWNSVRLLWPSIDDEERAAVVRVLRRCLKECDQYGPYIL